MKLELSIHASEEEAGAIELYLSAKDMKFLIKEIYGILLNSANIDIALSKTQKIIKTMEMGQLLDINVSEV